MNDTKGKQPHQENTIVSPTSDGGSNGSGTMTKVVEAAPPPTMVHQKQMMVYHPPSHQITSVHPLANINPSMNTHQPNHAAAASAWGYPPPPMVTPQMVQQNNGAAASYPTIQHTLSYDAHAPMPPSFCGVGQFIYPAGPPPTLHQVQQHQQRQQMVNHQSTQYQQYVPQYRHGAPLMHQMCHPPAISRQLLPMYGHPPVTAPQQQQKQLRRSVSMPILKQSMEQHQSTLMQVHRLQQHAMNNSTTNYDFMMPTKTTHANINGGKVQESPSTTTILKTVSFGASPLSSSDGTYLTKKTETPSDDNNNMIATAKNSTEAAAATPCNNVVDRRQRSYQDVSADATNNASTVSDKKVTATSNNDNDFKRENLSPVDALFAAGK